MYRIHIQYDDKLQQKEILEAFEILNNTDTSKKFEIEAAWQQLKEAVEGSYYMGRLTVYDVNNTPIVSRLLPYQFFCNIEDDWAPQELAAELLAYIQVTQLTYSEPYHK